MYNKALSLYFIPPFYQFVAVITSSVAKITLVAAEITFKVVVITSSVDQISFFVAKTSFVGAVITSLVDKTSLCVV